MKNLETLLFSLASNVQHAAASLCTAVESCRRCCVTEISDLHRQSIFELSEAETCFYRGDRQPTGHALCIAYRLTDCIHHAFSAAMLLPEDLPPLPPLCDVAKCSEMLSHYPQMLLEHSPIDFFSMHALSNKGRGAHALLVLHYCTLEGGKQLLPLAYAMDALRSTLEDACARLLSELGEKQCE